MEAKPSGELWIGSATAEERPEALRLVLSHLTAESGIDANVLMGQGDRAKGAAWEGLLVARRAGQVVGAVLVEPQVGRAAAVWFPRLLAGEPPSVASHLLSAANDHLACQNVRIAQCLLRSPGRTEDALLRGAGFESLGRLFYLVSLEADFPATAPVDNLAFIPYSPANHFRLAKVVEETYRDTLDCPQLNGVRSVDDVLSGYRASGTFDPRRWLMVAHDGQDVGCLLLADYPDQENYELVYMGLRSDVRGKGWGLQITRQAQWLTRRAGRPRLVLAVDAANGPAIRMYAAAGFRAWDYRQVYVKVFAATDHGR